MEGTSEGPVLLRVEDLVVEFPAAKRRKVHAVSGVSLEVR
jgi:ABC-type glutathione transport system ATPase component